MHHSARGSTTTRDAARLAEERRGSRATLPALQMYTRIDEQLCRAA